MLLKQTPAEIGILISTIIPKSDYSLQTFRLSNMTKVQRSMSKLLRPQVKKPGHVCHIGKSLSMPQN